MRLKDLVGKMAIRTAEPFSTEPPSGIVLKVLFRL